MLENGILLRKTDDRKVADIFHHSFGHRAHKVTRTEQLETTVYEGI